MKLYQAEALLRVLALGDAASFGEARRLARPQADKSAVAPTRPPPRAPPRTPPLTRRPSCALPRPSLPHPRTLPRPSLPRRR
eukprot:2498281-Prymnesium_polylepis.2